MENQEINKIDTTNLLLNFFKKKQKYLYVVLILVILILISFFYLDHRKENLNLKASDNYNYAKILIDQEKLDKSKKILTSLIKDDSGFHSALALNLIIDQDLEKDQNKIVEFFEIVLKKRNLDNENKNLIRLKKAMYVSNYKSEQEILKILNPVINSNSIWKGNSINFLKQYYLSQGENEKAKQFEKALKNN